MCVFECVSVRVGPLSLAWECVCENTRLHTQEENRIRREEEERLRKEEEERKKAEKAAAKAARGMSYSGLALCHLGLCFCFEHGFCSTTSSRYLSM